MARPYTIKFGQWLPDLQDVGIEMPFQWTETELPVADCENVFWQDAAYRSLPAPLAFAPTLGIPIIACFTWYDNTAGKEVVFAMTASGCYTLIDNVWTQLPVQQNANAGTVGYAVSMGMGVPFAVAVYLSPTGESGSGTASTYTFPTVTAVCGNGTPSSHTWAFTGASGPGSWSIASGQGTAAAVPEVTGSTAGNTSSVTLECTVVVNGGSYTVTTPLSYSQVAGSVQHTYTSGSGTETAPAGYSNVVIEVWGGGGGGGSGETFTHSGIPTEYSGGSGGGSGYSRSSYAVTAGKTLAYSVGNGGAATATGASSTVASGTQSITTMTATGGTGGVAYTSGGGAGVGGSASGGNQANTAGGAGEIGHAGASTGGNPQAGTYANTGPTEGVGGAGGLGNGSPGASGITGLISFYYT